MTTVAGSGVSSQVSKASPEMVIRAATTKLYDIHAFNHGSI